MFCNLRLQNEYVIGNYELYKSAWESEGMPSHTHKPYIFDYDFNELIYDKKKPPLMKLKQAADVLRAHISEAKDTLISIIR